MLSLIRHLGKGYHCHAIGTMHCHFRRINTLRLRISSCPTEVWESIACFSIPWDLTSYPQGMLLYIIWKITTATGFEPVDREISIFWFPTRRIRPTMLCCQNTDDRTRTDTGHPHPGLNRMRLPITPHLHNDRGRIRTCGPDFSGLLLSRKAVLANSPTRPYFFINGDSGIRTPEPIFTPIYSFQDCRIRPLCQISKMPSVGVEPTYLRRLLLRQVRIPFPP